MRTDSSDGVRNDLSDWVWTDWNGEATMVTEILRVTHMFLGMECLQMCSIHSLDTVRRICNRLQRVKPLAELLSYDVWS